VVQLHRRIDELRAAGATVTVTPAGPVTRGSADVIVIGNGSPSFIDGFREQTGWRGPIFTDPSLAVYKAAGLKRGVLRTLDPRGVLRGIGTLSRGFRQGRTQGDQWQQGGVLVVAPSGDVLWSQASDGPGDNATVDEILTALATRAA
jgi:hypothetical protein